MCHHGYLILGVPVMLLQSHKFVCLKVCNCQLYEIKLHDITLISNIVKIRPDTLERKYAERWTHSCINSRHSWNDLSYDNLVLLNLRFS
jgi:hypothetical protein